MKVVFMGTPEFAVPCLKMLVDEGYEIGAVITQPDKPKGRGNKLALPPVKEYAQKVGLKVLQPERIKTPEFLEELKSIAPELLVTAAYGKMLPKGLLDLPVYGCINVHGSLLPAYRGAAPIHWAIINGEKVTGITTMFTDIGMDTGDMLLKKEVEIGDDMTVGELHDKMSEVGSEVLKETLERLKDGTLQRTPQDNAIATYAPIIKKDLGLLDWNKSSKEIHNLVRGTNPWPGAFTFYKSDRMRVWKTEYLKETYSQHPGTIISISDEGMTVASGTGSIRIKELQFDSGKKMSPAQYAVGHSIDIGTVLGGN